MIGKKLGHYEIIGKLGQGGMGEVYRARDSRLGRDVALKCIRSELSSDRAQLERLRREARTLAALDHPNIVTIHSVEEIEENLFLTMALAEGKTLDGLIPPQGLPLDEFLSLARPILAALVAAHEKGIVHRDLKPGNVMVTDRGQLKVLDFGLAKLVAPDHIGDQKDTPTDFATDRGAILGTTPYMSPEQIEGKLLDHRSDIFSLGILLYEMLSGGRPFQEDSAARTISAILRDDAEPLNARRPELPGQISDLVHRCLEKRAEDRVQSAAEILDLLEALEDPLSAAEKRSDASLAAKAARAMGEENWREALEILRDMEIRGEMTAEDFHRLAWAAFWTGQRDESAKALERAYGLFMADEEKERAALAAVQLAEYYYAMNSKVVMKTWLRRAEKLVADHPDSVTAGHVLRFQARQIIEARGDFAAGMALAERVIAIGERSGDRGLWALGIQDRGQIRVHSGQPQPGLVDIDDAMAAAVSGELPTEITGRLFCNMMSICQAVADYERASEWCEVGGEWSAKHSASPYPGICRVHRAELLRLRGNWSEAERQAQETVAEFTNQSPGVTAEAAYLIGEIQMRRGQFDEAERSFQQAHDLGRDPLPGLALLRLQQDQVDAAASLMDRALAELDQAPFQQAKLWPACLKIALARGDLKRGRQVVEKLDTVARMTNTTALLAYSATAPGSFYLAEGRVQEAVTELKRACKLSLEIDLSYETASNRALLGQAFALSGLDEDAMLEYRAAESIFDNLGAVFDLADTRRRIAELRT